MNKKLFTIILVAIFLVAGAGFVCASDSDDGSQTISVKIKWNGDSQSDRPDFVTVNLIKDGTIVGNAKLSAGNSWSAKFTVDGDGSYSVQQDSDLSDYSVTTKGSASTGFVITNTFKAEVLGIAETDDTLEADNDVIPALADDNGTATDNNDTDNETDEGNTDTNTTDENETETTGDDSPIVDSPSNTDVEKKVEKKVVKKTEKKPNETKHNLKNTGLPVIALIMVVFVAAFVPFTRKK